MQSNIQHKDSLFTMLFNTPDKLKELYEALTGVSLPNDVPIKINTLDNVLYMGRVNDLSFTVGNQLVVLIEHQSTINPNMPLRLLMYMARLYEKLMDDRSLYTSNPLIVPRPLFYVLYNGQAPYPNKEVLKLSNMFAPLDRELFPNENPIQLELEVTVYNINEGKNPSILEHSQTLAGYSIFIEKIRMFIKQGLNREEAFNEAIDYCKHNDIMKEFLNLHSSEVFNMLTTVWNWDDALTVRGEEERQKGMQQGIQQGIQQGVNHLLAYGMSKEQVSKIMHMTMDEINILTGLQE